MDLHIYDTERHDTTVMTTPNLGVPKQNDIWM
jgi:hypothetical protein